MSKYSVKEIYLTKQGEGYHTGKSAIFIRFSGCNLWSGLEKDRSKAICNWCDTDFVGTNGINGGHYDIEKIIKIIRKLWDPNIKDEPYIVCTGGEPLLQLDQDFVDNVHLAGFKIGIETNGTRIPPKNIDWICVSPKKNSKIILVEGDELKFVYPQSDFDPVQFEKLNFNFFFIQPMDNNKYNENKMMTENFIKNNPSWRLSLQTHKILGFP